MRTEADTLSILSIDFDRRELGVPMSCSGNLQFAPGESP
jgi:hypothetical protein